jgi:hypothetical protein
MRKAFDSKRSTISVLEVEAVPQSCIVNVNIVSDGAIKAEADEQWVVEAT